MTVESKTQKAKIETLALNKETVQDLTELGVGPAKGAAFADRGAGEYSAPSRYPMCR